MALSSFFSKPGCGVGGGAEGARVTTLPAVTETLSIPCALFEGLITWKTKSTTPKKKFIPNSIKTACREAVSAFFLSLANMLIRRWQIF